MDEHAEGDEGGNDLGAEASVLRASQAQPAIEPMPTRWKMRVEGGAGADAFEAVVLHEDDADEVDDAVGEEGVAAELRLTMVMSTSMPMAATMRVWWLVKAMPNMNAAQ
jgi:hypothetical protein